MSKKEDLAREYADNLMKTSRPYHVQEYGCSELRMLQISMCIISNRHTRMDGMPA